MVSVLPTVAWASTLSGIALILLGIALLAGGMYFYRRATGLRATMPAPVKWGTGLLVLQGFLIYLTVLLVVGGVAVTQGSLGLTLFELALATADIAFGVGLLNRKQWAWVGALVAQAVGAAVAIFVEWPSLSSIVGSTLYPLVVVVLLGRQSARSWLAGGGAGPIPR